MILRGAWIALLVGLAAPAGAQSYAPNPARPPGPADRAALAAMGWPAARDALGAALTKAYQPGVSPTHLGANGQASFQAWLRLWQWCELLSRTEKNAPQGLRAFQAKPGRPLAESVPPEILAEWLADAELSGMLFDNLSPLDNDAEVLRILASIRMAHPANFKDYRALALAIALVYDQPRPASWPHAQVKTSDVPVSNILPRASFLFWVELNSDGRRLADLRKLSPEMIKFIVDAPLSPLEFDWARANVRFSRSDFPKAYESVRYATERAQAGEYDWNSGAYTLENIRKGGGICVDQAYFAAIAGKARCLPTLLFTGQGTHGGHAWFAYLRTDDRWALDCGRTDDGYITGEAWDPQTWKLISDHELKFLAERFRDKPEFAASQNDLLLARLFIARDNLAGARAALDSALAVCPRNPAAWEAKAAFLDATGAPLAEQRALREAAVKQFAALPDLKTLHMAVLATLAERDGDAALAARLRQQIVTENRRSRPDLATNQVAERLAGLVTEGKLDEAFRDYERQVSAVGRNAGGNFFYEVVEPFTLVLLRANDSARAREAVRVARRRLAPASGSILDRDMQNLEASTTAAARGAPAASR